MIISLSTVLYIATMFDIISLYISYKSKRQSIGYTFNKTFNKSKYIINLPSVIREKTDNAIENMQFKE